MNQVARGCASLTILEKYARPCKPMQGFVLTAFVSYHLAIIKLTRTCIVDDVVDYH